jgi:hypothetical protein
VNKELGRTFDGATGKTRPEVVVQMAQLGDRQEDEEEEEEKKKKKKKKMNFLSYE